MRKEAEQELIQSGTVSADDIHAAKTKSRSNRVSILLNLLEGRSSKSCKAIAEILAQHYKIPLLSLNKMNPPEQMMSLCTPKQSRKLYFLPVAEHGNQVIVGMVDPLDLHYNDEVRAIFQKSVQPVFISMNDFEHNYYRYFRKGAALPGGNPALMNTAALKKAFLNSDEPDLSGDEKDIIAGKFATTILSRALASGASGFSIEPQQDVALINISVDATEYNLFRISISNHKALVDAMMRLAKVDPPIHEGIDQFSRCQVKYHGQQYILSYSFRQTPTGERVTVHILNPRLNDLTIENLGLTNQDVTKLKQAFESPGIILVTGPGGSGKSTMLQAMTRYATTLNKAVFTVEDVVGLKIEGVRQLQVKTQGPSKGKILKALQQKGADIIVVDEIDRQTLPAALDMVESGKLLLLSIHAPDISEAIAKLLRSGVARSRVAAALKLVCTHKAIRKLCPDCKTGADIHSQTVTQWQIPDSIDFTSGKGCESCNQTGYKGILNISEQLNISEKLADMISQGASGPEVFNAGRAEGTLTLIEQGFNKAIDGTTSLEEVLAAIPYHEAFAVKARMRMGRVMPLQEEPAAATSAVKKSASPFPPSKPGIFPDTDGNGSITFSDMASPDDKKQEIIKEEEKPVQTPPPPAQNATDSDANKANILLVDDSPVTLEFTRHILTVSGYFNVEACDTTKKALEMLQEKQYHLVITDQEMPEQTGQEFIESIRQHPALNGVGTILLTGNLNEMSALGSGADGYIAKPTDPELLVARAKSISDIYKRLSGMTPAKPATPLPATPTTASIPGKVEFTAQDMAKISSFELDVASAEAPQPTAPVESPDEDSSDFDSLFK